MVVVYVYMIYACGVVYVSYVYGVVYGCGVMCKCSVMWCVCMLYVCCGELGVVVGVGVVHPDESRGAYFHISTCRNQSRKLNLFLSLSLLP